MITWNFQYISKTRLAEALKQFSHNTRKGDILIRIHTAIHTGEEAVDLAKYIKTIVPDAHIFGTSTSAVIVGGKLIQIFGLRLVLFVVDSYFHISFLRRHYPHQVLWVFSQLWHTPQHPEYY